MLFPEGPCELAAPPAAGVIVGGGFRARPKPARGLDAAFRGMNIPPVAVGAALRAFAGTSSLSENRN
jgi:hypothetical protein